MAAALTRGVFTRTDAEIELTRERAHIKTILDATRRPTVTKDVATLLCATESAESVDDFTALRILAQHVAQNGGRVVSPHLKPALERFYKS